MWRARALWLSVGLFALLVRCAVAQEIGTIAELQEVVEVERGGAWTAATVGAPVQAGDRVRTNGTGRVRILLRDGSLLNLARNTELVIAEQVFEPDQGTLRSLLSLTKGTLRALVSEAYSVVGAVWEVDTPTAVVGVRGTEFVVTDDPLTDTTEVVGISGTVEVRSVLDRKRRGVLVRAHQVTVVQPGQLPSPPMGIEEQQLHDYLRDVGPIVPDPIDSLSTAQPVVAAQQVPAPDQPKQLRAQPPLGPLTTMRGLPGGAAALSYWTPTDVTKQPEPAVKSTGGVGVHF